MKRLAAFLLPALLLLAAAPKPVIVMHPDDMMDSPQPRASIAHWQNAPGRERIALRVPQAMLRGYAYAGAAKRFTLVAFGGSGNLVQRHDTAMRGFARDVARVQWYDYRGYGFSSGKAHYPLLLSDALRIVDRAAAQAGGIDNVVVLGYSMGTNVALHVAEKRKIHAVILAAPWTDIVAAGDYSDPKHVYRVDARAASLFDNVALIRRVRVPLLVFQGTRDDAIPPSEGPALERVAGSARKQFVPIVGAKHNGLLERPESQYAVRTFIASLR